MVEKPNQKKPFELGHNGQHTSNLRMSITVLKKIDPW